MPNYADFKAFIEAGAGARVWLWHRGRKESLQVLSYNDAARLLALRTHGGTRSALWASPAELAFMTYSETDELLNKDDVVTAEGCTGTVVEVVKPEDFEPDLARIVWQDKAPNRPDKARRLTPLEILAYQT